ncbi:MAG: hypothetical protein V3T55_03190 [Anaerolineales bacterium]
MTETKLIHDLYIRELTLEETNGSAKLHVLSDDDHLLRRFGQVQVIRKSPGRSETLCLREVADEVWALIEGEVEFAWHDLRQDSPSQGHWHHLHSKTPTLVLAPFGVAFGCRAMKDPALLVRLSTHAENVHSGDREIPWEFEA